MRFSEVITVLFFFLILFAVSFHELKTVKAIERQAHQVTLTPGQIKKAVCTGVKDTNGTFIECTVFPVGSKL